MKKRAPLRRRRSGAQAARETDRRSRRRAEWKTSEEVRVEEREGGGIWKGGVGRVAGRSPSLAIARASVDAIQHRSGRAGGGRSRPPWALAFSPLRKGCRRMMVERESTGGGGRHRQGARRQREPTQELFRPLSGRGFRLGTEVGAVGIRVLRSAGCELGKHGKLGRSLRRPFDGQGVYRDW